MKSDVNSSRKSGRILPLNVEEVGNEYDEKIELLGGAEVPISEKEILDRFSVRQDVEMWSEERLHQEMYTYCYNRRPMVRGLLCYNLGNSQSGYHGNINRSKGLIPGRTDFTFYWKGRAYFIEVKTMKGVLSRDQNNWINLVGKQGFTVFIVRSVGQMVRVIDMVIAGNYNY